MTMDPGTNDLNILLSDSPHDAPTYRPPEYRGANMTTAHVVGKGTIGGFPTVDLIFIDENGQKYVAMLTGKLIQGLASAVQGMEERTK